MNLVKMDQQIQSWIKEAASRIRDSFAEELKVDTKQNRHDLVTNMDRLTETYFINQINEHYPEHRILGEEGMSKPISDLEGYVWIIDPIDGTMNFVKQQFNFAIMIGVYKDGEGVLGYIYDVMMDELYHAIAGEGAYLNNQPLEPVADIALSESLIGLNFVMIAKNLYHAREIGASAMGVRGIGSAGIEFIQLFKGRFAAYICHSLCPWDIAAGAVIGKELGLVCTTIDGKPLNFMENNAIMFATPATHKEIVTTYFN